MPRTMVEQSCEQCGTRFSARLEAVKRGFGRFCSHPCYAAHRRARPHISRYITWTSSTHPMASPSGRVMAHRAILYDKIGPGPQRCHWCGKALEWINGGRGARAVVPDHLDNNGLNNDPANLVPSCSSCNTNRMTTTGITSTGLFIESGGERRRGMSRSCERCGKSFVARADLVKQGRKRFCSAECRHDRALYPGVSG